MQLKTKPILLSLIVILGITAIAFLLTSYLRYTSPLAVLNYIRTHPADVAILCVDPQNPGNPYTQNADQPFPLAASFKLVLLAAYADEVSAGRLDPQESIPLAELDKYYLPGTDGGAQPEFIKSLGAGRDSLSLDEVVEGMTAYGSNAAADYLTMRLQAVDFAAFYQRLGMRHTSQPGSLLGLYLFIKNHETGMYAEEDLTPAELRAEQTRLADLFVNNPVWRQAEVDFISKPTNAAPLFVQKQVVNNFGMQGSAGDIASILLAAYGHTESLSPQATALMRQHLEWPMRLNPENTKTFQTLASVSGAWPGVLTSAWYAQPLNAEPRVLVVLYRELPDDFWNTWISTFSHQQLETQILNNADCAGFSK